VDTMISSAASIRDLHPKRRFWFELSEVLFTLRNALKG
jgi:hypothetical protein